MKKIIKIIIILFCLIIISGESYFLFKSDESYNYDYILKESTKNYDYLPLEKKNYKTGYINQDDKAIIEEKIYTRINLINKENYAVKNIENFYIGEIFESGDELILDNDEVKVLNHKSRISSIKENNITIDNLDMVTCTIQISDITVIQELLNVEYSCEIYDKNIELVPISYSFNENHLVYSVNLKIPYEIEMFESQYILITLKSKFYIEGLFLETAFLQEDSDGYFVYKMITLDSGKMYKKIYVTKISEKGKYSLILSDELNKDNEVILYVG